MNRYVLCLSSLLFAGAAFAQTITYNWNSEAEFNSFSAFDVGAPTSITPTYDATGGLGVAGSGAFSFATDNGGNFGTFTTGDETVSFNLSQDQVITQSTFFQAGTLTSFGADNRPGLYLGLTSEASVTAANNGGQPNVQATAAGLYIDDFDDGSGNIGAAFGFLSGGGSGGFVASQGSFTLTQGNWYFMEVTFTYTAALSRWSPSVVIRNADAEGNIGSEVATSAITQVYTDTWSGNTGLRGYIASRGGTRVNVGLLDSTTLVAANEPTDPEVPEPSGPNILFLTADDLGVEIGAYGDTVATTPNMDSLATDGILFTRGYVTNPSCSPSRSSMLTGLYTHTNGQVGLTHRGYQMFSGLFPTLPGELKAAGYYTGVIGKIHVNPENTFPFDYKQTTYEDARDGDLIAQRFSAFLNDAGSAPWFMMINFTDPHKPFVDVLNGRPAVTVQAEDMPIFPWLKPQPTSQAGIENDQADAAGYYNGVNRLDEAVGLILDILDDNNLSDNTLIVFIGDHGAPLDGAKLNLYEAGVRVPFILKWPELNLAGVTEDALVSTVDIMPTFLDAAGLEQTGFGQGRSLLPLVNDTATGWRTSLATEYVAHTPQAFFPMRSLRNDQYKLIVNYLKLPDIANTVIDNGQTVSDLLTFFSGRPPYELYDLTTDPHETNNLADTLPDQLQTMLGELSKWQEETNDPFRTDGYVLELASQHAGLSGDFTETIPRDPASTPASIEELEVGSDFTFKWRGFPSQSYVIEVAETLPNWLDHETIVCETVELQEYSITKGEEDDQQFVRIAVEVPEAN